MGVREGDDLLAIARIGEDFLVAGHGGIEHHLANSGAWGTDRIANKNRAVRKGELDPIVRELAITRTGILCEAPYEVVAHKRIGKGVGVTDEQNAALDNWKTANCFDDVQKAALAFTDEIVTMRKPTDATLDAIAAKLSPAALIELQLSVGFYIMTSKFLETFGVDMQAEGAPAG